jgi:hypothetical protein
MMKISKVFGLAAALALLWGCGSSDDGGEIPGDIATILSQSCGDCHGNPVANDAPFPIVTCNDVIAALNGIRTRINSEDLAVVMPPGAPLAAGPLATLNEWLDDGAPPCQ